MPTEACFQKIQSYLRFTCIGTVPRRHGILLPCISDVVFRHQSRSLVPTLNRHRCDIGYVSRICRNWCVVTLRRTKVTPTSDHDKEFKQFCLFHIYYSRYIIYVAPIRENYTESKELFDDKLYSSCITKTSTRRVTDVTIL